MKRRATDCEAGLIAVLALMAVDIVRDTDITWARVYAAIREAKRMRDNPPASCMRNTP